MSSDKLDFIIPFYKYIIYIFIYDCIYKILQEAMKYESRQEPAIIFFWNVTKKLFYSNSGIIIHQCPFIRR